MAFIVNEPVEEYAAEHTTPVAELFERLAEETRAKTTAPQMKVGRIEGQFLARLVRLSGARHNIRREQFEAFVRSVREFMAATAPVGGRATAAE